MNTKMFKARTNLLIHYPFFGSLALRLILVEDPSCKTMWTDGESIGFNPKYVAPLSLKETEAVIAHEVLHCALLHHERAKDRDWKKWNYAADYAVNPLLHEAGLNLPDNLLYDVKFVNLSAETIYNLLPPGNYDESHSGEVRPGQSKKHAPKVNWKIATVQAATLANSSGNLPAGIQRLAHDLITPKVNWIAVLREFMATNSKSDYSFSKPNPRYSYSGILMPSLDAKELGEIVIAIDTSGSISGEDLSAFESEISSLLEEFNTNIIVLYSDARIQKVERFSSYDLPLNLKAPGGGGTNFRPVFDWIEKEGETPHCLIYFTDLDGDFPNLLPDFPVLWLSRSKHRSAPFGQVVYFD